MTIEKLKELFKFSWAQAWSDKCGKSSVTGWTGWFLAVIGGLMSLYGAIIKYSDAMMYGLGISTLGTGLLGYRKSQEKHDTDKFPTVTDNPTTTESTTIAQTTTVTQETANEQPPQ
jgi:hypothetical protein